jgi:hypothetical protein
MHLGKAASTGYITYRQIVDKILEGIGGFVTDRGELKNSDTDLPLRPPQMPRETKLSSRP